MQITVTWADWLHLLTYYMGISLIAVAGAISAIPDMHRFLVERQHWLTEAQFTASVTLAQAAPGPNMLFVALMGSSVGLNSAAGGDLAGWRSGLLGLGLALSGVVLPSASLCWVATRWARRNSHRRSVRAFRQGLAPVVVGLMVSTGWVLAAGNGDWRHEGARWALAAAATLVAWRTRIHLLWMLGVGAILGAAGWV
ncbi:chromate transporter [Xylophilus sp.]|uniref:chromate transporter n=1 Tax=Xylophilus sp. TaxID=2653893 RepID=UPI0013B61362|nr:chromate transporter [Xylophilus sp.]KAF1047972.1 MAG: putative chromate transport protein [Xylophilus sp.]